MNLVIDIGNTRLKVAVFQRESIKDISYCKHKDAVGIINVILGEYAITRAIVSSVAIEISDILALLSNNDIEVIFFDRNIPLPIAIDYDVNSFPGLDRIADAVAIYSLSQKKNKLIIDIGTCITYNYVLENRFVGGAISPGLHMRYKSMNTFTERLPLVQERRKIKLIGSSTKESIQSGVINGITMEIQGICNQFETEYNDTETCITGGDGIFFAEGLKNTIFADPNLTLKGLNKILLFNK